MLQIAPEKVAHVIVRAREFDRKVASWGDDPDGTETEESPEAVLEDNGQDPIATELSSFIDVLNVDEQASLVALMWIGRGTYEAEELSDAIESALGERVNATSKYLMGIPLLADYLEDGLEKLGYNVEDVESDVL